MNEEEQSADKDISNEQNQTSQNMEPHIHPHIHHEKKWKDYLFEFLMLFLAVTAGFFAENIREHYVEHQKEKEYIRSLNNDLKADISELRSIIINRKIKESRLDSLLILLNNDSSNKNGNDLYYFAIFVSRGIGTRFTPNDGTMQQLKNAGGLRLINNQMVSHNIINYDVKVRSLVKDIESEEEMYQRYRGSS